MTGEGILVRDCMRTKINQVTPFTRPIFDDAEKFSLLRKKLLEEVGELLEAVDFTTALEEMGDVYQVLMEYAEAWGHTERAVERARENKLAIKGAFNTVLAWKQPEEN